MTWDGPGAAPTAHPTLTTRAGSQTRVGLVLSVSAAVLGVAVLGLLGLASVLPALAAVNWASGSSPVTLSGPSEGSSFSAPSRVGSPARSSTSAWPSSSPAGGQLALGNVPSSFAGSAWLTLPAADPTTSAETDAPLPPVDDSTPSTPPTTETPTETPTPTPAPTSVDESPVTGEETREFYVATTIALGLVVCLTAVHTVSSWGRS